MTIRAIDATLSPFGDDPRFTGTVRGVHLAPAEDPRLHAYVVRSEAGGRTAWHAHARGQLIICLAGRGHVGGRDGRVLELRPGVAVWTDAGDEHWHGAASDQALTNVAVQTEDPHGDSVRWLEELSGPDWAQALR